MKLLADWELTGPLLVLWPFRNDVWRQNGEPAQQQLLNLLEHLAPYHRVVIGVHPSRYDGVRESIASEIQLIPISYDDAWPRDIGPLWVLDSAQQPNAHGFQFSAWHGLYPNFHNDQLFAKRLAHQAQIPFTLHDLVFEGGAISTDGAGTAIIHSVSVARNNPTWSRSDIEAYMCETLGISNLLWLHFAHPDDETGGHADNQVQFLDRSTLVVSQPTSSSPLYHDYTKQLSQARSWRNVRGEAYQIVVVPQPQSLTPSFEDYLSVQEQPGVFRRGVRPLLASYVNFVRVGDVVVVPQFGLDTDAEALSLLRQAAPQLIVIGAAADEFIKAGGALHCMTLNLPATTQLT